MRLLVIVFIILYFTGCTTQPKKALRNAAIATGVGAIAGAVIAPKDESKEAHAALWGAASGLAYSGITFYQMYKDKKAQDSKRVQELSMELQKYKDQFDPKLIQKGVGLKEALLPNKLKGFIHPGEWKHYKLDQWVKDENQENVWVRQTELFEFIPPTIN
jgi:hypothetical protein